jgi:RNA polymerase sigma-70 factor (ECF subfamily)
MTSDLEQCSDDILIAGIAGGRAEAFTALFRRRQADVYRFALHMTGVPAVAEDVTQDVFVFVMRDAARYVVGRSTVVAWLCGIARNCARQRLERDRRLESLEDDSTVGEVRPDPVADLTRAARVAVLRKAVLALPLRYREVVVLCDLQELSYAEAADAVGCAIGTVRSRLHRARGLLAARVAVLESRKSMAAPGDHRAPGSVLEPPGNEPETTMVESPAPIDDRSAPSAERRTPSGSPGRCLA